MINIVTSLYPYRLTASLKEPVELTVTFTNTDPQVKLVSFEIGLEQTLSFDKKGLDKVQTFRLGDLVGGGSKTLRFSIYAVDGIRPGISRAKVVVKEHFSNYDQVQTKTEKIIEIRVV